MRAVILNSGLGSRMGEMTRNAPKCFAKLKDGKTILERQILQLAGEGISDFLITTGPFPGMIQAFVEERFPELRVTYVENALYFQTNYIYSLYLAREWLDTDLLLIHGDLVFEDRVLRDVLASPQSCMACDSTLPLPEKDFKAVVIQERIKKVGVGFFESALAAQPLYKLLLKDWRIWLESIVRYCESGNTKVYAENAFNEVSSECALYPLDVLGGLCGEVDTLEDLQSINSRIWIM